MTYVYDSTLHPTGLAALAHCAYEWLTAGGDNGDAEVRQALAEMTDEEMADDMVKNFGLDQTREFDGLGRQIHLQEGEEYPDTLGLWEVDRDDAVRAMRDLRDEILSAPVEVDETEAA